MYTIHGHLPGIHYALTSLRYCSPACAISVLGPFPPASCQGRFYVWVDTPRPAMPGRAQSWPSCHYILLALVSYTLCWPVCLCYLARVPYTLLSSLYALYIMHGFISAAGVFAKVASTPSYGPRSGYFRSKAPWLRLRQNANICSDSALCSYGPSIVVFAF